MRRLLVIGDVGADDDFELATVPMDLSTAAFDDAIAGAERAPVAPVAPSDPTAILFTSGTTGPSKGVVMPHGLLVFFADEGVSTTRLTDRDARNRLRCVRAAPGASYVNEFRGRFRVEFSVEAYGQTEISSPLLALRQ